MTLVKLIASGEPEAFALNFLPSTPCLLVYRVSILFFGVVVSVIAFNQQLFVPFNIRTSLTGLRFNSFLHESDWAYIKPSFCILSQSGGVEFIELSSVYISIFIEKLHIGKSIVCEVVFNELPESTHILDLLERAVKVRSDELRQPESTTVTFVVQHRTECQVPLNKINQ